MALTAPSKDVWNPQKNYRRVRWIGDRDWQDFEGIEMQQIQDDARRQLFDRVFVDGSIIAEAGGTIATPTPGIAVGNVSALSSGSYTGLFTQIYTLRVLTGGLGGTAVIGVHSDGEDNGTDNQGYTIPILATDPLDGTVSYDAGTRGVKVAFLDNKAVKSFVPGDSWTILATYARQMPIVDTANSSITTQATVLYVNGCLLTVPAATLSYPPLLTGKSVVYIEIIKDIVTGDADPDIKAAFTGLNTAERERIAAKFQTRDTVNDPLPPQALWRRTLPAYLWDRASNTVDRATGRNIQFNLADIPGQLPAASLADLDFNDQLKSILAEIVSDITGGSYRIEGLEAKISTNAPPTGSVLITVEKGKARISGLKIIKTIEEDLPLDVASDTATVTNEGKNFVTGTDVYPLNKAVGTSKRPVSTVTLLSAVVQVTRSITKGSLNGLDTLPDTPVLSITTVSQGATTYTPTTDYKLTGNAVDWSPAGIEPSSGTSYNVTYRYTKTMINPTDYIVIDSDSDGNLDAVSFSPAGDNPVNGTTFFVSYNYFLPRIDLIFLRTDGEFQVLRGTPADTPIEPRAPTEYLGIAFVQLSGGTGSQINVVNIDNIRVTMAAMRNSIRRQDLLFRDTTLQDLLNQTQLRETAAFKAVFADAFALDNIGDKTFSRPGGTGGANAGTTITYDVTIDFYNFFCELSLVAQSVQLLSVLALTPAGDNNARFSRDFATLPFSEVAEIIQDQWSEQLNINPFASFQPPPALLAITPDKDVGVDETTSVITDLWIQDKHGLYRQAEGLTTDEAVQQQTAAALSTHRPQKNVGPYVSGVTLEETARLIVERGGTYMRQIVVTAQGFRFVAGEDSIAGTFDGKSVILAPTGATAPGSIGGTVRANPAVFDVNGDLTAAGGDWTATFVIPPDVPNGVRTFIVRGASGSVASATFQGDFIEREITIFQKETAVIPFDPLAQTFAFSRPCCLTRIRIPFADKPPASAPISSLQMEAQLRGVELPGGFPNQNIYESISRDAFAISVGPNSSNDFIFGNPMLQRANEFRAITLLSSSDQYEVYVATLGHSGLNPVAYITENPNVRGAEPPGILLESLNALNWEAASRSALRYSVFRAEFVGPAWIYFQRITGVQFSQIFIGADQVVPESTVIAWQISIDGLAIGNPGKVWKDIKPLVSLDLGTIATTIDVRVSLGSFDSRVTPYINFHNWHMLGWLFKSSGKYVSARAVMLQDVTSVKLYCDTYIPGSTALAFYISNSEDSSGNPIWEAITTLVSDVDLGDGFHEKTYSLTLNNAIGSKTSLKNVRLRVDFSTSNQAVSPVIRNLAATFN